MSAKKLVLYPYSSFSGTPEITTSRNSYFKSCDMQVWQFLSSLVPPPVIRPFLVRFDDAIDTTIDEHVLGVPAAKERC